MLGKNRNWERVDEQLSAYIDGALSPQERARLEAQLDRDADLRARLESLRRMVALIRAMPPAPAPRNFLLTPEMVRQPPPRVRQPVPAARRFAPALTFATAVSGLLCVILLVGNLVTAGWGGPRAAAPIPMIAPGTEESFHAQKSPVAPAEMAPSSLDATVSPEQPQLASAMTVSETVVPETQTWNEMTPSPLEEAPFPPEIGGMGGGAEPGPSLREPGEPEEPETPVFPTPAPEPLPSEQEGAAGATATPLMLEATPTSPPVEMPKAEPALPPTSWLTVGGLALMTVVLAFLSIRAWRAR